MTIEHKEGDAPGATSSPEKALTSRPYRIADPEATLDRIRERVRAYRWNALSEPEDASDWRHGPPVSFMQDLCRYWTDDYNWRAQEAVMNAVPHFMVTLV